MCILFAYIYNIYCIYIYIYIILYVIKSFSHCDFSVLSMSVIGFQTSLDRRVGGWGDL